MKKSSILLLIAGLCCACAAPQQTSDPQEAAALALTERVLGSSKHFEFHRIDSPKDSFTICSKGGKTVIEGNNANSMAVGLNHYLRYCAGVNVGWFVWDKVSVPCRWPKVEGKICSGARVKERFFLNYCTFGYTMPWWHWDEWEHFIDWMAMNGITLPLAITGQESIWHKVWTELGIPDEEVRAYFTGPAHLPWHRMLNIDRWGGPLPQSWLDGQQAMQQQIVARERELNMKPVLPAFSGHVPEALGAIYPEARINKMGSWAGFPVEDRPCFLDPMDPLFQVIQEKFLQKQTEIYGTDHIYGIDLFNEMTPPTDDPQELGRISRQVYEALAAADPDATWLQMTWLFWNERKFWTNERVEPFITSYPAEHSILLDYYCERQEIWQRTEKYFGVPYVWCYLGNFGGNTYLAGNWQDIGERIENTFANGGDNFIGLGSTLEGFDCNPFMYQFVLDKAWDFPEHKDAAAYTRMLATSRTGVAGNAAAEQAWTDLLGTIYSERSVPGHSPLMNLRPSFGRSSSYHSSVRFKYDNDTLKTVILNLLEANGKGSAYEFDLVNLTRQWLANCFDAKVAEYKQAWESKDAEKLAALKTEMLGIFDSMDKLLASQSYFLVGKWIADARGWGATSEEADFYETNARNLLTSWGDRGNLLTDYADRSLNGLTATYYKPRWEMFFEEAEKCLADGTEFDEAALKEKIMDFEAAWWKERPGSFPAEPSGNSVALVKQIMQN